MSIPGIDYTVAQTCLAAIGDVSRFANAKKLAAYLGQIRRRASPENTATKEKSPSRGMRMRVGCGCKRCNIWVSIAALRANDSENRWVLLWHVLTSGEPFGYAPPRSPWCLQPTACHRWRRFVKVSESCWTGKDSMCSIANCRLLPAQRPSHQPLKQKNQKEISNLS